MSKLSTVAVLERNLLRAISVTDIEQVGAKSLVGYCASKTVCHTVGQLYLQLHGYY